MNVSYRQLILAGKKTSTRLASEGWCTPVVKVAGQAARDKRTWNNCAPRLAVT